ncbi:MAG: glycosyltransferase [Deltaproteobacteria bacterium]|nr:glycosyltransferase [Deltaproteobacteria bacterium]
MKILHIGPVKNSVAEPDYDPGFDVFPGLGVDGPSRSILGLARALSNAGIETGVLPTKAFTKPSGLNGSVEFLTPYTGRKHNFFIRAGRWLRQIEAEFGRPDLVNFHDVYDLFSVVLASAMKKEGWSYIVTPRGGLRLFAQRRDSYKKKVANPLFFRRYLRNARFIHALADQEAEEVRLFDRSLKTIVVPNGIPSEFLSFAAKLPGGPSNGHEKREKRIVGFIGQIFVAIKGIDLMLAAIRKFQTLRNDLKFVFVGPIPTAMDQHWVQKMRGELPHANDVAFIGPKYGREKWAALNSFDVFALPSRTEGMPVVGLEAMAFGKPCLFSKGSNMAEVIREAEGGWDCGDGAETIYERLLEVARTPDAQLQKYGNNARRYVAEHFTWDKVVRSYIAMAERSLSC